MNEKLIIMGVGNWLQSDDGVGVHAAQALALDPPPGVEVVDAGTDALSALPFFEQADRMLIIDAVRAGGMPGTIRRFTENELAQQQSMTTIHAVNLLVSRYLMAPGAAWPEVLILGVEPGVLDYGMVLSPAVAAALPQVLSRSREIIDSWKHATAHR